MRKHVVRNRLAVEGIALLVCCPVDPSDGPFNASHFSAVNRAIHLSVGIIEELPLRRSAAERTRF